MCGGGSLAGGLIGGVAGFFLGGPAGAAKGAALGFSAGATHDQAKAVEEAADAQKKALKQAQRQRQALMERQEAEANKRGPREVDKARAAAIRASAATQGESRPMGSRTGARGVQDALLRLGKTKLGGS